MCCRLLTTGKVFVVWLVAGWWVVCRVSVLSYSSLISSLISSSHPIFPTIQLISPTPLILILQTPQEMNAQNHNQQPNRNQNQQRKPKPTQHHRTSTNSTLHASITQILRNLGSGNRGSVLPEYGDQDED